MPPPEPTTSPTVDLEARFEPTYLKVHRREHQTYLDNECPYCAESRHECRYRAEVARLQAQVAELQEERNFWQSSQEECHELHTADGHGRVVSMREVVEAARALLRSRTWANSSLVTSSAAPVRRLENAVLAMRRLDATPQPQGGG